MAYGLRISLCGLALLSGVVSCQSPVTTTPASKPKSTSMKKVTPSTTPSVGAKRWPGHGDPLVEKARKRILWRESKGNYAAVDAKRRWFGAYQFALSTSDAAARQMNRPDLIGVTANQWSQNDQDAAFYIIYDNGRGKSHWKGVLRE